METKNLFQCEGVFEEFYLRKKLIFPEEIGDKVGQIKASGKTIATLNGSFDLLHAGHLEIIAQAAMQADVLLD